MRIFICCTLGTNGLNGTFIFSYLSFLRQHALAIFLAWGFRSIFRFFTSEIKKWSLPPSLLGSPSPGKALCNSPDVTWPRQVHTHTHTHIHTHTNTHTHTHTHTQRERERERERECVTQKTFLCVGRRRIQRSQGETFFKRQGKKNFCRGGSRERDGVLDASKNAWFLKSV